MMWKQRVGLILIVLFVSLVGVTSLASNLKVWSSASGITYTLNWTMWDIGTSCSGTVKSSGSNAAVGAGPGQMETVGVGDNESLTLTASSTSNQGGAFLR